MFGLFLLGLRGKSRSWFQYLLELDALHFLKGYASPDRPTHLLPRTNSRHTYLRNGRFLMRPPTRNHYKNEQLLILIL